MEYLLVNMKESWINVLLVGTVLSSFFLYTLGKNINYHTTFTYLLLGSGIFMKFMSRSVDIFNKTDKDYMKPSVIKDIALKFTKMSVPSVLLLIQIGFMIRLDRLTSGTLFSNRRKIENMKGLDTELIGYLIFLVVQVAIINLLDIEIYTINIAMSFFIINLILYLDMNKKISNMIDDVILQNKT